MAAVSNTKTTMSYTTAIMTSSRIGKTVTSTTSAPTTTSQSFAAKLTAETALPASGQPVTPQLSPAAPSPAPTTPQPPIPAPQPPQPSASPTPPPPTTSTATSTTSTTLEYSLFNDTFTKVSLSSISCV